MRKILGYVLCLLLIGFTAYAGMSTLFFRGSAGETCTLVYDASAPNFVQSAVIHVGRYSHDDYTGPMYRPDSDQCVCKVDFEFYDLDGDISAIDYYVQIYTLDGSTPRQLNTLLGTAGVLHGSDIDSVGYTGGPYWFSQTEAGAAIFSSCVNLTSGNYYAIIVQASTDGDITDSPEYDGVNWMELSLDDENSFDTVQWGMGQWLYDGGLPYPHDDTNQYDAEDDYLIKVYSME